MDHLIWCVMLLIYIAPIQSQSEDNKPNIIIILADDMGFDDVSFRGSNQHITPNIDALAYSGVIFKNLYTPAMCTPSRAALLTGKYPINTGMQHYVIPNDQPWGLPVGEKTIADIFQENGYYTSLFGKWHLGMSRKAYTPTKRGFNKHYGYLGAYIDYYTHTLDPNKYNYSSGHDLRDNLSITHDRKGTYVTDLLTEMAIKHVRDHNTTAKPIFMIMSHLAPHSANDDEPLQAPAEEIEKFSYIKDTNQRTYAAMMSKLDHSVGQLVDALAQKDVLKNSIILFLSDNGGPTEGMHSTTASNYPLKGQKHTPWEGGIRSSAAIWSPLLSKLGTVWKQQIYIGDLLPTLAAAAGLQIDSKALKLDGLNLWSALRYGYESVEREIVHNIDDIFNYVSYGKGKWKFVNGTTDEGKNDRWLGHRNADEIDNRIEHYEEIIHNTTVWKQLSVFNMDIETVNIADLRMEASVKCTYTEENVPCRPLEEPCFFDIDEDPCEQNNLFSKYHNSTILLDMLERINYFRTHAHSPNNKPTDPLCDPKLYDFEWTWWEDIRDGNTASVRSNLNKYNTFLLLIVLIILNRILQNV